MLSDMEKRVENLLQDDALNHRSGSPTYDTAIPQEWSNRVHELTGEWPTGHVVWWYPYRGHGSLMGIPCPTDAKGVQILAMYGSLAGPQDHRGHP